MKDLFSMDRPLMQILSKIADVILVNLLTILCSLPVVTVGAALTANHKLMQGLVRKEEQPVFRTYFHAFRINFVQSTLVWLVLAVYLISAGCSFYYITAKYQGGFANTVYVFLGLLLLLVCSVVSYLFPLIARYDNTLRQHLKNAIALTLARPGQTLLLLLVDAVWAVLLLMCLPSIGDSIVLWMAFGVSLPVLLADLILLPVFRGLETPPEEESAA